MGRAMRAWLALPHLFRLSVFSANASLFFGVLVYLITASWVGAVVVTVVVFNVYLRIGLEHHEARHHR